MKAGGILAALVCIGAGLYLLATQAVADNSFLEVLAHGIGIYFIGKGLFVGTTVAMQQKQLDVQTKQLELQTMAHQRASRPERRAAEPQGAMK